MISDLPLGEFEMAQLGNLVPETSEEAKSLIPSLATKIDDEPLQKLLTDLSAARQFQA